jgi:FAD/FMN-containing dehydrogenase
MNEQKERLMEIVGKAGICDEPGLCESYSLAQDLVPALKSSFRVQPKDVDDVQKILLWANETSTPLVPVSSGEPHLRGTAAPSAPASVLVDLSGMKRIFKIDRRNRLALIEPGVTFGELQPELAKAGLRMISPLLPKKSKSVITSLLEREPVISPRYQWNMSEPLRSLEVIWGSGEKFWSGSGFFHLDQEHSWKQGLVPLVGPGPAQLDFYKLVSAAQGSMGIVTMASVKCEVLPEFRKLFFIPATRLDELIDPVYRLLRYRFGDELFIVNHVCLAHMLAQEASHMQSLKETLPPWTIIAGVTGGQILARERVQAREEDIQTIMQQAGLRMVSAVPGCNSSELQEIILKPCEQPFWKLRYKGGSQELFFLTPLERTLAFTSEMVGLASEHQYPTSDLGVYIQPLHQGVSCHCEFMLPFDRYNREERVRTLALFRDASMRLFRRGAYFSRPYGIWANMVYNADAQTMIVTQKVKQIFDPNNIMNPGKLCF